MIGCPFAAVHGCREKKAAIANSLFEGAWSGAALILLPLSNNWAGTSVSLSVIMSPANACSGSVTHQIMNEL